MTWKRPCFPTRTRGPARRPPPTSRRRARSSASSPSRAGRRRPATTGTSSAPLGRMWITTAVTPATTSSSGTSPTRPSSPARRTASCSPASSPIPYTGKTIKFERGQTTSSKVQIDHVIPLSDAWQKGAQQWTKTKRKEFANDPLNLMAVDGPLNGQKSDSDAATWLPPRKAYRCEYIARQIDVKVEVRPVGHLRGKGGHVGRPVLLLISRRPGSPSRPSRRSSGCSGGSVRPPCRRRRCPRARSPSSAACPWRRRCPARARCRP